MKELVEKIGELAGNRAFRIVVVEDSETQAFKLRLLLEEQGWEVSVAGAAGRCSFMKAFVLATRSASGSGSFGPTMPPMADLRRASSSAD